MKPHRRSENNVRRQAIGEASVSQRALVSQPPFAHAQERVKAVARISNTLTQAEASATRGGVYIA